MCTNTMAEANTPPRSFMDYLPDLLAMVVKENLMLSKALHHKRMKEVCHSIKAHYLWVNFEQFFPTSVARHCVFCGESISPEFDMRRHRGLCAVKERLADEAFDGLSAHESFYTCSYPYTSRSSYSSPSWV